MKNLDRKLGKFVMKLWAVVAFIASLPSIGFGMYVISSALIPGILLILLGGFFIWAGVRAWRDDSPLGDILNRDFKSVEKAALNNKPKK